MPLQLRGTFSPNPRMKPLIDGTVKAKDIEITWESGSPADLHERHLRESAHDVFEFSISNYMITKERPNPLWDWTAIPIFFSRALLAVNSYVNVRSGIETAADLRGKRFGIPDYTMTAGVWFRAMLRELYGIRPQDVSWFVTRPPEHSHGVQLGVDKDGPADVSIEWLKEGEGVRMLTSGELDAAFPAGSINFPTDHPDVRRLFPDGGREFVASFLQKTGFTPVNHTVLVQRKLAEKEPWVPEALYDAFERSKLEAYRRDPHGRDMFHDGRDDLDWQRSVFGDDPFPSGLSANRATLKMGAEQSNVDGLTREPAKIDELFWETVKNT
jgi:4,5-dihydroxyphthalate decarboxylase